MQSYILESHRFCIPSTPILIPLLGLAWLGTEKPKLARDSPLGRCTPPTSPILLEDPPGTPERASGDERDHLETGLLSGPQHPSPLCTGR